MACAGAASASVVTVDALKNSVVGGTALDSLVHLDVNQTFTVTADPSMIWNFGGGNPSYNTNADGFGWPISEPNPDGSAFYANTGALVGQIGTGTANAGNYFMVGSNFSGMANATGKLNLFFWDVDAYNNSGSVDADINAVPEPVTLGLMALGLFALARRRRA